MCGPPAVARGASRRHVAHTDKQRPEQPLQLPRHLLPLKCWPIGNSTAIGSGGRAVKTGSVLPSSFSRPTTIVSPSWNSPASKPLGERILHVALQRAADGPGAELRVVALPSPASRRAASVSSILTPCSASRLGHSAHLQVHDLPHVLLRQPVEDDDLVDAIQELGPEGFLQSRFDILPQLPLLLAQVVLRRKPIVPPLPT